MSSEIGSTSVSTTGPAAASKLEKRVQLFGYLVLLLGLLVLIAAIFQNPVHLPWAVFMLVFGSISLWVRHPSLGVAYKIGLAPIALTTALNDQSLWIKLLGFTVFITSSFAQVPWGHYKQNKVASDAHFPRFIGIFPITGFVVSLVTVLLSGGLFLFAYEWMASLSRLSNQMIFHGLLALVCMGISICISSLLSHFPHVNLSKAGLLFNLFSMIFQFLLIG